MEEYYHWLPFLLDKDEEGNKIPNKFTILPLDEPHFTINANTRAIGIPDEFKKNGVAVQGDELAEIVYFEIDRFFDAMDLNNCNILIQWETPKGPNGIIKGVSKEYVRDIESKPNKLIFGWALDKNITNASGKLKFSVKFYELDEVEKDGKTVSIIVYSFNTLTANVTIHPSIELDLANEGSYIVSENAANSLLERLEPGVIVGNAEAAEPKFLDFPYGEGGEDEDGYDVGEDGTLALFALAYSPDTGVIEYDWRKRELSLDNELTGTIKTIKYDSEKDYVPVSFEDLEKELNDSSTADKTKHRIIFNKIDESFSVIGTGEFVINSGDKFKGQALFEKKAKLVVDKPGVYSVRAKNHIANSLKSIASTNFGADKVVILKRPEDIKMIAGEVANKHFIEDGSAKLAPKYEDGVGIHTYQWFKAVEVDGKPAPNTAAGKASLTGLPPNGVISYGENKIRIAVPDYFDVPHQNVGEGGDPERYYVTFSAKAPENAVYFLEKRLTLGNGVAEIDTELTKLADKGNTTHRVCWFSIAEYNPQISKFEYFGKGRSEENCDGKVETLEWYDENQNLISIDEYTIQYVSKDNYKPFYTYNAVLGATSAEYTPEESGIYHLQVTRERNNDSKFANSIDYRVTNLPSVPELTESKEFEIKTIDIDENTRFSIKLKEQEADSYIVEIKRVHVNAKGETADFVVRQIEQYASNEILIDPNNFISAIEAHNTEFNESLELDGLYYAVITTVLNGGESTPLITSEEGNKLTWNIIEV